MELEFFYTLVVTLLQPFAEKYAWSYLVCLIVISIATLALWFSFLIFQGFGLYAMGKKRGMTKKWMAFMPFLNIIFLGRLVGECEVFGQRMKRTGVYAMIAQSVVTMLSLASIASFQYLLLKHGEPLQSAPFWSGLTGFSAVVEKFYSISYFILMIAELVAVILMAILLMGLYKQYAPKNYMIFGMLAFFLPASRFIIIFVLRNRTPIDYAAYVRARREAYIRQQQEYYNRYGNSYGNPYSNPYGNPYARPNPSATQNPTAQQPPEEPFAEFSSNDTKTEETSASDGFSASSSEDDGFFD